MRAENIHLVLTKCFNSNPIAADGIDTQFSFVSWKASLFVKRSTVAVFKAKSFLFLMVHFYFTSHKPNNAIHTSIDEIDRRECL